MRKIINYQILSEPQDLLSDKKLCIEIKAYIKKGWQPYGNLLIADYWIYQAMVKYEESTDDAL
jgi:hypothetical protein